MWGQFHPELDPEIREKARIMLGQDMAQRVDSGEGALYEGAEEMLTELKNSGYTLIFLSNCRFHYLERHKRVFGLDRFFDYFYCCEAFDFIPKYEIFRKIAPNHEGSFIVIGDRFHDIETAVKNSLSSVGCAYGYGSLEELSDADIIVKDITEIPEAVRKLAVS
jgi:phosphoglycolate phosphatase